MRNSIITAGQLFAVVALGLMHSGDSRNAAQALDAAGYQFNNGDMYLRLDITGKGGISELIDSNTKKVDGVSSFNGVTLETGINQVLEKIRFGYATSAKADGEKSPALVRYTNKYSQVPAVLANADLVLSQNGKDILTVPIQRLLTTSDSPKVAGVEDAYELEAMRLLREKTDLKIAIRFPEGKSIGSDANHFVELHLIGTQTARKA